MHKHCLALCLALTFLLCPTFLDYGGNLFPYSIAAADGRNIPTLTGEDDFYINGEPPTEEEQKEDSERWRARLESVLDISFPDLEELSNPAGYHEDGLCSFRSFVTELAKNETGRRVFREKADNSFVPEEIRERLEKAAEKDTNYNYLVRLFAGLRHLNKDRKTLILMYGEYTDFKRGEDHAYSKRISMNYTCVWLIGPNGLIAGSAVLSTVDSRSVLFPHVSANSSDSNDCCNAQSLDDDFMQGIWAGLQVVTRSAGRSPKSRTRRGHCDTTIGAETALTEQELDAEQVALKKASEILLPPSISEALIKESTGNSRLLISPIRSAQKIPFPALSLGDDYLVDRYVLMVIPFINRITDIGNLDVNAPFRKTRPRPVLDVSEPAVTQRSETLVVGSPNLDSHTRECWPDLPHAREEALYVAGVFGDGAPLLGKSASFASVVARLKAGQETLKYIHFATHGVSDPVNPADGSFLALSNKHLRGSDLRKLDLHFDNRPVVVMSACFSGLGKTLFAAGVFGLSEFWGDAGASQVVVSLWGVSDAGTNALMQLFANELHSSGQIDSKAPFGSGAEYALAAAMRKLKQTEPDPAIWSAFVVIGAPTE